MVAAIDNESLSNVETLMVAITIMVAGNETSTNLIGNTVVEQMDAERGEYVVGSTVIMIEYRDDQQRIFAGRQHHRLRRADASFFIVQKRVDLINCDSAFEAMAVPI